MGVSWIFNLLVFAKVIFVGTTADLKTHLNQDIFFEGKLWILEPACFWQSQIDAAYSKSTWMGVDVWMFHFYLSTLMWSRYTCYTKKLPINFHKSQKEVPEPRPVIYISWNPFVFAQALKKSKKMDICFSGPPPQKKNNSQSMILSSGQNKRDAQFLSEIWANFLCKHMQKWPGFCLTPGCGPMGCWNI